MVRTCVRAGIQFSVVMTENTKIVAAIEGIDEDAWTPVKYPGAVQDPDTGAWISDAEVAATTYTAFESSKHAVTARLIVRRIIAIPARLARPARKPVLHLPAGWPGQHPLSICGTTQSPSPEPLHNRPHRDQEPATSNQQPATSNHSENAGQTSELHLATTYFTGTDPSLAVHRYESTDPGLE